MYVECFFPQRPESLLFLRKLLEETLNSNTLSYLIEEYETSKQSFERALGLNTVPIDEEPDNPIYKRNQAETFDKYVKLLSKLGRNEKAEDYRTKSEEIYRKLA